ncbi:MAG: KH domain-containing protein [Kiritimatiellia bacterium]|nr:KH domain-containing protein [Kiritimatiellia bacterium]
MKELLTTALHALVDHPGDLRIGALEGDKIVLFDVRCHPEDVGKIIGKGGKTISALRSLLAAVASRTGKRLVLEVAE